MISSMQIKIGRSAAAGQIIKTTLSYIRHDIPIVIVLCVLGVVSDKDVLEHIYYDPNGYQMLEMLKPCIEEVFVNQDNHLALDFIGKRGTSTGLKKE